MYMYMYMYMCRHTHMHSRMYIYIPFICLSSPFVCKTSLRPLSCERLAFFASWMSQGLPLASSSSDPPDERWVLAADGARPFCRQAGCYRPLPPSSGAERCSLCTRLQALRAECLELSAESPQARTIEELLDICIRLAGEGLLDQAIESGTVAAYRTARQP